MSTEALRGTSQHQFLGRRNELSARLEMDRRKGQNGYGRRLRHQTRCDPSGSNLYRRSYRLGSVICRGQVARAREVRFLVLAPSRTALQPSRRRLSEISRTLRGAFFDRRSRLPLLAHSFTRCGAETCPELGVDRKRPAYSQSDAIDPQQK